MDNTIEVIDGYLVRNTSPLSIRQIERQMQSDAILKKGLLFVGGARQGKTNVMRKVVSDIFDNKEDEDAVVFLDVKGDYYSTFFQEGDMVLDLLDDSCIWNVFEELKMLPFGYELDAKVREIIEYLFYGQQSEKEPFWTNAAKLITYCFMMYLLMEAEENNDDSNLNHEALCRMIDGELGYINEDSELEDIYNTYRRILNTYEKFQAIQVFLPPLETGSNMGGSIITEIIVMRQKLFLGTFGTRKTRANQQYISSGTLPMLSNSKVLFLEYNPTYQMSCACVFRCFIDMLIATYLDARTYKGKLYLVLDEIALLPELNRLAQALALGAQAGIRVIAGLQEIEQIKQNYRSNPHQANVIIGAFQSVIMFHSDTETVSYMQKRFGEALVSRKFIRAGGGVGFTEPVKVQTIESYEFAELTTGDAIVSFEGSRAFKIHFPRYC
ncbi:MAG: type IV secretion system DNA-binding domain-containing protein [Lachnospiraceae bacterium]|nr:type IV secretion system DNA-binding domain-containing protein [Lachnospiraceae bacterium]